MIYVKSNRGHIIPMIDIIQQNFYNYHILSFFIIYFNFIICIDLHTCTYDTKLYREISRLA